MFKILLSSLLIIFIPVACTPLPASTPTATENRPEVSATATSVPKSNLPVGAAVTYSRRGGIAGLDETWTIYPDGQVIQTLQAQGEKREKKWQIQAVEVEALVGRLDGIGFFELTGNYRPLNPCCDRITYEIAARSGEMMNQLVTVDAAPDTPAEVWQVIEVLNAFIGRFNQQGG